MNIYKTLHKVVRLLVLFLTVLNYCFSFAYSISPYDCGLSEATTGEQRYQVLYETHTKALAVGAAVDYSGISFLEITIPKNAKSIPLADNNDFKNVRIVVTNHTKDFFLFRYINQSMSIDVLAKDIDVGCFIKYPELREGRHLLAISDDSLWVDKRQNYNYGHTRKDILLVSNGIARNKTIMPYNNKNSAPKCLIYELQSHSVVVKNITFQRVEGNEYKTYLFDIKGLDNLCLKNIRIITPKSDLTDDVAIKIYDCTNVTLSNISIKGTYSRTDHSGYGINLNNIWNLYVDNMFGQGNWGVFGNNNLNEVTVTNSKINRFDIHCYGKNIAFKKVTFFDLYNQFSSTFGTISFDRCEFDDFIPIINGTSYNAYVAYDLVFNKCTLYVNNKCNYLIKAGRIDTVVNKRPELTKKCWPNIKIKNMKVVVDDDVSDFYLFKVLKDNSCNYNIRYISQISISKMMFCHNTNGSPVNFYFSNKKVATDNTLKIQIKKLDNVSVINPQINIDNDKNTISIRKSRYSTLIMKE